MRLWYSSRLPVGAIAHSTETLSGSQKYGNPVSGLLHKILSILLTRTLDQLSGHNIYIRKPCRGLNELYPETLFQVRVTKSSVVSF
jgi:hypothetical protein